MSDENIVGDGVILVTSKDSPAYAILPEAWKPSRVDLARSPILDLWSLTDGGRALTGVVYEHPSLADGRTIVTSRLRVFAPNLGWARTQSRFYKLVRRNIETSN